MQEENRNGGAAHHQGAREHNLRDVSLELPWDALIVFTGLSGSGKSSLAFDTIFAEGQRRYVESLSAYARQFLGQMDKPDVDFIEGLSPAVSIDQKSTNRNPARPWGRSPRSTTTCACCSRGSVARTVRCGDPISRQTPQQIVDRILELPDGTRFQVLAPLVRERKGEYVDLFRQLQAQGYARVRVDGELFPDRAAQAEEARETPVDVIIDRLAVKTSARQRITDSVETALGLSGGTVTLDFVDRADGDSEREQTFSEHLACPATVCRSRNSSRGRSRSTPRSVPAWNVPGRHLDGGRPGSGDPRRRVDVGRRRDLGLDQRSHE